MARLRRIAPALLLLILAPVVAEFLLGDFTVKRLALALAFLPQYGGGALLIREIARRTGRGWPTIVMLAVAYALIEEGFATQSLFNPDYAGQRLLDYGYIPALGTSPVWAVFVLSIHVVWSVSTPILIAEGIAGRRRTTPWLGRIGVAVASALFVVGCAFTAFISLASSKFVTPAPHLAVVAVLLILVTAAAFFAFRPGAPGGGDGGPAPAPWLVGVVVLVLSTAFQLAEFRAPRLGAPALVPVLGMLACELAAAVVIAMWARRDGWGPFHYLAIAAGTVVTYSWLGLSSFLQGRTNLGVRTDAVDIIGQVALILVILGVIGWAALRNRRTAAGQPVAPGLA